MNLFQRSYYIFDIICDRKKGIIICMASVVDFLQFQEYVTHKILNKKGPTIESCGTTEKISSKELKMEFTLVLYLRFDT